MALLSLEEGLVIFLPILAFWVYSGLYEAMGSMDKYRLFPREEEDKKNIMTRWHAIKWILFNQACQVVVSLGLLSLIGKRDVNIPQPPLYVQALQLLVAMLVQDGWHYLIHRVSHTNRFLYKHIHAFHHKLVVPYSFGAQYQHPFEALNDIIGGALAYTVAGMTPRTSMFLFTLGVIKTVDDHCGMWIPGHPFHKIFSNNSAFHTVHHQFYGSKANFSSLYFTFWDKIMGTYLPYTLEEKKEGGFELKPVKED